MNNTTPKIEVEQANSRFYEALESADVEAMEAIWLHSDEVTCAHPGRVPLRGWEQVNSSWRAMFAAGGNPQIIVTEVIVTVRGTIAWVTVTENLLASEHAGAAAAINIFERIGGRWQMVAHHSGPVMA